MADCPPQCATWARDYFGYCLCTTNQAISLTLGFVSVISWGIAEIPQFITNCKTKSPEGLSLLFLLTWIIGDLFNMFGCLLETATLPTQLYMAMLYTVTTVTLTLQLVYYRYIYARFKCNRQYPTVAETNQMEVAGEYNEDQNSGAEKFVTGSRGHRPNSTVLQSVTTMSSPIPLPAVACSQSAGQDSFYTH
ncbi:Lysosomal amino acid transporter 1 [Bienertia sinuspersici]